MGLALRLFQLLCFTWTEQEILFVDVPVVYACACLFEHSSPNLRARAHVCVFAGPVLSLLCR